jgi:hypothetical protein
MMSSDVRVLGENLGSCPESDDILEIDLLTSLKGLLWNPGRMGGIRRGVMTSICLPKRHRAPKG